MDGLLRRRIVEALDEAQELENQQHQAESDKRYQDREKAEEEFRERTLRAIERVAISFQQISETLRAIHCSGELRCNHR